MLKHHRIDNSSPIHCRIDSSSPTFKLSILALPKSIGSIVALLYFQTKKGDGRTKKGAWVKDPYTLAQISPSTNPSDLWEACPKFNSLDLWEACQNSNPWISGEHVQNSRSRLKSSFCRDHR